MTKHVETKHQLQQKKKTEFSEMLDEAMLNENEKNMMRMFYVEQKNLDFIADELGYTKAGVIKMHQRILKRIESFL